MLLTDLLTNLDSKLTNDIRSVTVTGLSSDTRQIKHGDLFFALFGTKENGAHYITEAVAKGAAAIIHSADDLNLSTKVPLIRVTDTNQVLAEVAAKYYNHPSKSLYLAGVTGTNGKTTLTYLLEKLWHPDPAGVIGTVNTRYAGMNFESTHTTPDSISLNRILKNMRKNGAACVAIEVSSHALDQKRAASLDFDLGIFTNLTQDHLDYHKDMESYYEAKRQLFTEYLVKSSKASKLAVLNIDDAYGKRLAKEIQGLSVKTFSMTSAADMRLKSASFSFAGTKAEIVYQDQTYPLVTNLIGLHNLRNVMAALLGALHRNSDLKGLLERLSQVTVPGRLERVSGKNYFVDYAHTPDALENVIRALQEVRKESGAKSRLVTVFGCGGDRDRTKRPLMGKVAAELSDVVLITSDNPRTEDPDKIVADILPGVEGSKPKFDGNSGYLIEVDRAKALERAVQIATHDDIVLVAGKGHENYQIIGTVKRHFDDREILAELLK